MKTDDGAGRPTLSDTYATRTPSPASLDAMTAMVDDGAKVRGVGLEEFERGLLECGLLDAEGLRACLEGLPSGESPTDSEGLARGLVRLGKLTRYQAAALFQGKGRALRIGPYVVLDKLGSGGMGMVFKARRGEGAEVALKLLPPSSSKHPQAVLRFRREAEVLAKLDHPNIVSSHDIGECQGVHYLVMDYVEGRDLDKIVRSGGPMKAPRAVDCILQAARGLAAAHERGIVHRDIKPANLLLDAKGTVRVLDLGLARITQAEDTLEGLEAGPTLTASGIIMGTVDFLPPEQSDDSKRADHRADIYALGCTLHYLLTARPPYSGDTLMQRLIAHHHKPIPSLLEARTDVPVEVDALFRRMLAKAPEDRPQSMLEVVETLEAWRSSPSGGKGLRVFDDGEPSRPASRESKPRRRDRAPSRVRKSPEDSQTYDLMTFVRPELFEPDPEPDEPPVDPAPIPQRRSKKARSLRKRIDLAFRCLVATAAIVVILRFFPKLPTTWPSTVRAPATEVAKPKSSPMPAPSVAAKVETPKAESSPTPEVAKIADPPKDDRPPPPLMHRIFGPPPGQGPPLYGTPRPPPMGGPGPNDGRRPPPMGPAGPPPPRRLGSVPVGGSGPF